MMKTKARFLFSLMLIYLLFTYSCNKSDDIQISGPVPEISTLIVSDITSLSAKCGGNITSAAGSAIIARGICWSTAQNPTISDNKTDDGNGVGVFTSIISGLTIGTTYYVRAYATNSYGTAYGAVRKFQSFNLGIKMENIPAGTFTMGSPESEVYHYTDETQHQVSLSAYMISKYEITNAEFASFLNVKNIGSNGLYSTGTYPSEVLIYESSGNSDWGLHFTNGKWVSVNGYENYPVTKVTWFGATEFAKYIGGSLPTEAQWEYACRGGTNSPFSTGSCLTNTQANYNWAYPYYTCNNTIAISLNHPQDVGSYEPNTYGLFDMHGNAWEWCKDWYGTYSETPQTNPEGVAVGTYRIVRGGSWDLGARDCRSAYRNYGNPNIISNLIGFRIVFVK